MIMTSTVVDCFNPLFIVTLLQWQMLNVLPGNISVPVNYTPGIYADGYIVFAFPFVCSFVSSFLRS